MDEPKVIKAECTPELKAKLEAFRKKKGETEASIIRKAVTKYITNEAPKRL